MLDSMVAFVFIASVVVLPFAWRLRADRRKEEALELQAQLQRTADTRLGGESYLVVAVEPALIGQGGRVVLSAPARWRTLVDQVWREVRDATPAGYDLVVPGDRSREVMPQRVLLEKPV
jgi:hypothetical protein